jgi:integrase/recombinase XerD
MPSSQLNSIYARLTPLPIGRASAKFLDYLTVEAGLAENTRLAYGRDLLDFAKYCQTKKVTAINEIEPNTIYAYIRHLSAPNGDKKHGKSESSVSRSLAAIKMLIRFALLTGEITDDFTSIIEGPKPWQRLPKIAGKEAIMTLLTAPTPDDTYYLRDKAILEMLYATGARASEVATMQTNNLNLKIGYLRCIGKGSKERIIPLSKAAIAAITDYLEDADTGRHKLAKPFSKNNLFLSRTGRRLDRIDIWRIVKKYAARTSLPKNMTVHTLRHCFATHLLSGGANLRSVQEMLGHVDIATTQIYTHVDQKRLRAIHKKFHPRP